MPSSGAVGVATLRGKVYDEAMGLVDGGTVSVRSLTASSPFTTEVPVTGGAYVVNGVPAGVQIEIIAKKANWNSRTRVESLVATPTADKIVNFGGNVNDAQDPNGAPFFISDYPEVTVASGSYADGKMSYVLRLSEPLDDTNRRLLERSLQITSSIPGGFATIRQGSTFLGDLITATTSWNAEGTELTLKFDAPLLADRTDKKTYTLNLSRGVGEAVIQDSAGKALGLVIPSEPANYAEAFKMSSLVMPSTAATGQARWEATHQGSSTFSVPKDDKNPKLVSVSATPFVSGGVDQVRFMLTFDEPMQVFPSVSSASTTVLDNYIFALSDKSLDGTDVSGTVGPSVSVSGDVVNDRPFRFAAGSNAQVTLSSSDPKVVFVTVPRSVVPSGTKFYKVRVEAVQDPSGNVISTTGKVDANLTADNIKSGAL
jgi:hypothetical protein